MEGIVLEADNSGGFDEGNGLDEEVVGDAPQEKVKVPPVATPKQIGGLTNLGKTFLWSEKEVNDKHEYAEAQMI